MTKYNYCIFVKNSSQHLNILLETYIQLSEV